MKKYLLTSSKFEGEIELMYNTEGFLIFYHYRAKMTTVQFTHFLENMPIGLANLKYMGSKSESLKIEELPVEITFDAFYDAYALKRNAKRAKEVWDKMSAKNRYEAFVFINKYKARTKNDNVAMRYPDTYLSKETWKD